MGRGLLALVALLCALSVSTQAEAQRRVLLYLPGGDRAVSAAMPTTGPDRAVVTRVSAAAWSALTAADFASYDLIWIDEQACASTAGSTYAAVAANRSVWSPQVTGNVVLLTGDSTYHGSTTGFNRNAYYWGIAGTGTGLYVSVGCIGHSGGTATPDWLQGLGTLTYTGLGCSDTISFADSAHPLITTPSPITPAGMSVGCFFHERWVSFPSEFRAIINVNGSYPGVIVRESTLAPDGDPCSDPSICASGFCVDGVCCDTVCGSGATDDCQACTAALTASSNGTCAPISSGTTCRTSTGVCDPAEACDGSATLCPADSLSVAGTECRASTGGCDPAEACDGASVSCPPDLFGADGTECRASAGVCDVAEQCSGSSAACPADARVAAGTECRATMGICDVAESCDGSSVACPANGFTAAGAECRGAMGACDLAEACTGSGAACPMDLVVAGGAECRAVAGACDLSETCDGTSAACPADGFLALDTECRGSAGVCDIGERCDGASAACPPDAFAAADAECRAVAGGCDVAETCDGTGASCPDDAYMAAETECRAVAGGCDVAEACDGAGAACPEDAFVAAETECRASAGACDVAEACDGAGAGCPDDAFMAAETECRVVAGSCDVLEACDGVTGACPDDAFVEDGTSCDDGEVCNGIQTCAIGVCEEAAAPNCDDGNGCTADMCAEPDGCISEPIEGCCATDLDCADSDECTLDICDVETGICSNTQIEGCGMEPAGDGGTLGDAGVGAPEAGGCGCSVPGARTGTMFWALFGLLGVVAWRRRRR